MTPLAQVIRPHIEPGRRVIAVSDVHGNLPFLKGVLEKVHFSPSDVLIIVGDLLEKGRYSLDTLRYVMELQKSHTVYTLCGNCDYIDCVFLKGGTSGGSFSIQINRRYGSPVKYRDIDQEVWPILSEFWRERSVLIQMAMEAGLPFPKEIGRAHV